MVTQPTDSSRPFQNLHRAIRAEVDKLPLLVVRGRTPERHELLGRTGHTKQRDPSANGELPLLLLSCDPLGAPHLHPEGHRPGERRVTCGLDAGMRGST